MRSLRWLFLLALCASSLGCKTYSKEECRTELLRLEKNRWLRPQTTRVDLPPWMVAEGNPKRIELSYVRLPADRPDAPTIVFIHGVPSSMYTWSRVLARLQGRYELIAFDLPGQGSSENLSKYGRSEMASVAEAFCSSIGVRRAVFVGSSYGGETALRLARARSNPVERLVLIGSSGYTRGCDEKGFDCVLSVRGLGELLFCLTPRWIVRIALDSSFGDEKALSDELVDERYVLVHTRGCRSCALEMTRRERGGLDDMIRAVEQPTLLVWGEKDTRFSLEGHGRRFRREMKHAQLVVVPGCGHTPQEEQPDLVADTIDRFVRGERVESPEPPPKSQREDSAESSAPSFEWSSLTASSDRRVLRFSVGQRWLDEDLWSPTDEPTALGLEFVWQSAGDLVGVETGLSFALDGATVSDPTLGNVEIELQILETYLGLHRSFGGPAATLHPYVGAGAAFVAVDYSGSNGTVDVSDDDRSFAWYAHGGLDCQVSQNFSIGIDYRILRGSSIELFGLAADVDHEQIALTVGIDF